MKQKGKQLIDGGWEEYDWYSCGRIIYCRSTTSGVEFCTLFKNGTVKVGQHPPK